MTSRSAAKAQTVARRIREREDDRGRKVLRHPVRVDQPEQHTEDALGDEEPDERSDERRDLRVHDAAEVAPSAPTSAAATSGRPTPRIASPGSSGTSMIASHGTPTRVTTIREVRTSASPAQAAITIFTSIDAVPAR